LGRRSLDAPRAHLLRVELVKMREEIYTYLAFAPPAHTKRLKTVLGRIADLLDDLEKKLEWIAS